MPVPPPTVPSIKLYIDDELITSTSSNNIFTVLVTSSGIKFSSSPSPDWDDPETYDTWLYEGQGTFNGLRWEYPAGTEYTAMIGEEFSHTGSSFTYNCYSIISGGQANPSITIGTLDIDKAYFGSTPIQSIYYGSTRVYEKETPSVTLISFTINGTTYQAEDGMTWGEWVESEYNTNHFINTGGYIFDNVARGVLQSNGVTAVQATDIIQSNGTYQLTEIIPGGGGSDI